jgi:hypothetical protein
MSEKGPKGDIAGQWSWRCRFLLGHRKRLLKATPGFSRAKRDLVHLSQNSAVAADRR